MLRSTRTSLKILKRGHGPQNAYNDQPQFLNRTVLVTPHDSDNITIDGQKYSPSKHGSLFAGRAEQAMNLVNRHQKNEGWHGLWMNTQKHIGKGWWRRKIANRTMGGIYQREMTRRVTFVNDITNIKSGYPRV